MTTRTIRHNTFGQKLVVKPEKGIIDLTEEAVDTAVFDFLKSLGLAAPVYEIVPFLKKAGASELKGLNLLAAAAQEDFEMYQSTALGDLKKADQVSWMTVARGLKKRKLGTWN